MKKLLFITFLLFVNFITSAQTTPWIGQGATWFYSWWVPAWTIGNDKIEYTHDTIIQGKICEVLETTRYSYVQPGPDEPLVLLSTQILTNNYTYSNGDTVFYYINNAFEVLYNFSAQPTDTWDLGIDTNNLLCSKSIVLVDSTSTMLIGVNAHRVIYLNHNTNASVGFYQKIVEHIGSLNYLFPVLMNCDSTFALDDAIFTFSCFEDSTVSYRIVEEAECANPYHVGISEFTKKMEQIKLYPNPVEDKLHLQFQNTNAISVSIYNILGEKVIDVRPREKLTEIDVSSLGSGIYLLIFEDEIGNRKVKKVNKK